MKIKEFLEKHSRTAAIALTATLVCAVALIAVCTRVQTPGTWQTANQPDTLARGKMLTLETTYSCCGHGEAKSEVLVCDGESVTLKQLEALYPGWQVTAFSANGASLCRSLDIPCGRHCLIKLDGNRLTISRLTDGVMKELGSATVQRETIDPETLARLKNGCLTSTLAEAEQFIEDIES